MCDEAEWEGLRPPAASPRRSSCLSDCSRCRFTEGGRGFRGVSRWFSEGVGGGGGLVICSLPSDCTSASLGCGRLRREAAYLRRLDLYGDIYGASEQLFGFCFLFLAARSQPVGYENCSAWVFKGLTDDMGVYLMRILRCCTALKHTRDILYSLSPPSE